MEDPTEKYWPPVYVEHDKPWSEVTNTPYGLDVYIAMRDIAANPPVPKGNFVVKLTTDRDGSYATWPHVNITALELRCLYADYLGGKL